MHSEQPDNPATYILSHALLTQRGKAASFPVQWWMPHMLWDSMNFVHYHAQTYSGAT